MCQITTRTTMRFKQILRWGFCIIFGNLISIFTDFFLSFFGPISWFSFYPQFIGVGLGSFFAGLIFKKRGWLIGIVVSIIHIIYIVLILSYHHTGLTEESMKIDLLSLWPTGISLIATGLVSGYFGEILYQRSSKGGESRGRPSIRRIRGIRG